VLVTKASSPRSPYPASDSPSSTHSSTDDDDSSSDGSSPKRSKLEEVDPEAIHAYDPLAPFWALPKQEFWDQSFFTPGNYIDFPSNY